MANESDVYGQLLQQFASGYKKPNRGASVGQQINEQAAMSKAQAAGSIALQQEENSAPQDMGGPGYLYGGGARIEDEIGDIADMLGQMEAGYKNSGDPIQMVNGTLKLRTNPLREIFELYKKKLGHQELNIRSKFKQGIATNDMRAPRSSQPQGGGSGAQSNINNFGSEPQAEQSGPLINFQSDYRLPPRETSDPYAPARDATIEAAIRYLKTVNPHRL